MGYLIIGVLWILLSDRIDAVAGSPPGLQTMKGLAFVVVTGSLLYILLRNHYRREYDRVSVDRRLLGMAPFFYRIADASGHTVWHNELWTGPGAPVTSDGFGAVHEEDREDYRRHFADYRIGDPFGPLRYRVRIDGEIRFLEESGLPAAAFGEGESMLTLAARDVTRAELDRHELERAHRDGAALLDLSQWVIRARTAEASASAALEALSARCLVVSASAVFGRGPGDAGWVRYAAFGPDPNGWRPDRLPPEPGYLPVRSEEQACWHVALQPTPTERALLVFRTNGADTLDPAVSGFVRGVAGLLSLALQRAKLDEKVRRLEQALIDADEAGRRRIARQLHDEIGSTLAAVRLELEVDPGETGRAERLGRAPELIRLLAARIRTLVAELRPVVLDDLGLSAALDALAESCSAESDLRVAFSDETGGRRFPTAVETALYRIAVDSVENARRHSTARSVRIIVRGLNGEAELHVLDDGEGFDADRADDGHRPGGLDLVTERVSLAGGRLEIDSAPGAGTRVSVWLPVAPRTERC